MNCISNILKVRRRKMFFSHQFYKVLFSAFHGNKSRHTGDIAKPTGLSPLMIAYSRYDVQTDFFQRQNYSACHLLSR
jgi:hypothetical protein